MIIMHTTSHREFGGLEKRVYNESCKMEEKGHKIVIAAPDKTPLFIKCQNRGFISLPIEFTAKSSIKDYSLLKRIYQELKPDVLNTHGNTDSKIALLAAANITLKPNLKLDIKYKRKEDKKSNKKNNNYIIPCTILSRHISADVKNSFYNQFLYNRLCNYVFTTADYTTKQLISTLSINPDRIFTIPSGIEPPKSMDSTNRDDSIISLALELTNHNSGVSINKESRFIGFVGRISEDKGVADIINAFLLITDKIPNYHLVMVGDGESNFIDRMKNMVNQTAYKKNIHFTGFREDTWNYYRAFDCHILASKEVEGISQSLLEAMYVRCPVIGSKIGGTCDIIKNGKTGLLFEPSNIGEIANNILQILHDKSSTAKMVEQAFNMVRDHYTIDSMVNRILNIYENQ